MRSVLALVSALVGLAFAGLGGWISYALCDAAWESREYQPAAEFWNDTVTNLEPGTYRWMVLWFADGWPYWLVGVAYLIVFAVGLGLLAWGIALWLGMRRSASDESA